MGKASWRQYIRNQFKTPSTSNPTHTAEKVPLPFITSPHRTRPEQKIRQNAKSLPTLPAFAVPKPTRRAINFAHRTHRKGSFVGKAHPTAGDMKTDQLHTANTSRAPIRTRCGSEPAAHRTGSQLIYPPTEALCAFHSLLVAPFLIFLHSVHGISSTSFLKFTPRA